MLRGPCYSSSSSSPPSVGFITGIHRVGVSLSNPQVARQEAPEACGLRLERSISPVIIISPVSSSRTMGPGAEDRKSTRLNSSHVATSYAVLCLKKKSTKNIRHQCQFCSSEQRVK